MQKKLNTERNERMTGMDWVEGLNDLQWNPNVNDGLE